MHYSKCSKWPPSARTQAHSLPRHCSIASSTMLCWNSVHISTSRCCNSATSQIGVWYTRSCIMPQIRQRLVEIWTEFCKTSCLLKISTEYCWKRNFWTFQGSAAALCGSGGQMYNHLLSNFWRMLCTKNYPNRPIFDWVIPKTKRWTFFFETQCISSRVGTTKMADHSQRVLTMVSQPSLEQKWRVNIASSVGHLLVLV